MQALGFCFFWAKPKERAVPAVRKRIILSWPDGRLSFFSSVYVFIGLQAKALLWLGW
jgi:hypothetical protein